MNLMYIRGEDGQFYPVRSIKGDKGAAFTYADMTPEQKEDLLGDTNAALDAIAALEQDYIDGAPLSVLKGEPGEKGDKGDPGEKGEKGDTGAPGAKGDKGDKGEPGAKGDTGAAGAPGAAAGFGTPTATVNANTGTPSVTVTASGSNTAKVFSFAFKNLKGEKGDKGDSGAGGTLSLLAGGATSADDETTAFTLPKPINQYAKLYLLSEMSSFSVGSRSLSNFSSVCLEVFSGGAMATGGYIATDEYGSATGSFGSVFVEAGNLTGNEIVCDNMRQADTVQIYGVSATA